MFSIFSQDQKVQTSTSNLWPVIRNALLGLPFAGGGLFMAGLGISILLSDPGASVILFVLSAICGGVGGYTFRNAYRWFRLWQVYGTSHLHLKTAPVPLGETLRARLRVPISSDDQPSSGFHVHVAATVENHDQTQTMWEDETSVSGQPGPGETEVPLSLDLPAQPLSGRRQQMVEAVPWSSVQDTLEHLDWTLEVTARLDDTDSRIGKPDYTASFDLPVSVPDNLDERTADDAAADGSISSPASAEPGTETAPADASDEEVYWSVDEEDESVADGESASFEPVSDRIEMEGGPGRRLSVSFSPATSWGKPLILSILTVLFPLFYGGMSLLYALQSSSAGAFATAIPFAAGCFVMAVFFVYWYWSRWLHTATVAVENGAVKLTETRLFASGRTTSIPCEALDNVKVEQTENESYSLSLVQAPSRSTGPRSHNQEIWVAGGLDNKAEAEWFADRIRQAAEQQAAPA